MPRPVLSCGPGVEMTVSVPRYAVIGHPIAHSLSPQIHQIFAERTGIQLSYERLLAPRDDFAGVASAFFENAGQGLNVTLPFKEVAHAWVAHHAGYAARAGAVNTIAIDPVSGPHSAPLLVGHNTDGPGLLRDLSRLLPLAGARILVLGAGGAVRGVLEPILERQPGQVVLCNRTASRADALAADFADHRLQACALVDLSGPFDLVVNGTAASLSGDLLPIATDLVQGAWCYDMAYTRDGAAATAFCQWAAASGAAGVSDGLGMLVEQAALAFEIWHGQLPETHGIVARLRNALTDPASNPTSGEHPDG